MQRREEKSGQIKFMVSCLEHFALGRRLNSCHILLYVALLRAWSENDFKSPFFIDAGKIMSESRIHSRGNFYKYMYELSELGFFLHSPFTSSIRGIMVHIGRRLMF